WEKKDERAWSIPKGEADNNESGDRLLDVAKREFEEETGIKPIGTFRRLASVRRSDGKIVEAWAFEGDCDTTRIKSNTIWIEWPPRSGKKLEIPEVDRGEFFTFDRAKEKVHPYLVGLIEELETLLLG
ncbi:MAG TPA: NUDIX domain-containing protein, partial [Nitrospiria bacterium]|nr:NUDIX domain-containing protein [Nitrospiria bacterium]